MELAYFSEFTFSNLLSVQGSLLFILPFTVLLRHIFILEYGDYFKGNFFKLYISNWNVSYFLRRLALLLIVQVSYYFQGEVVQFDQKLSLTGLILILFGLLEVAGIGTYSLAGVINHTPGITNRAFLSIFFYSPITIFSGVYYKSIFQLPGSGSGIIFIDGLIFLILEELFSYMLISYECNNPGFTESNLSFLILFRNSLFWICLYHYFQVLSFQFPTFYQFIIDSASSSTGMSSSSFFTGALFLFTCIGIFNDFPSFIATSKGFNMTEILFLMVLGNLCNSLLIQLVGILGSKISVSIFPFKLVALTTMIVFQGLTMAYFMTISSDGLSPQEEENEEEVPVIQNSISQLLLHFVRIFNPCVIPGLFGPATMATSIALAASYSLQDFTLINITVLFINLVITALFCCLPSSWTNIIIGYLLLSTIRLT